MLSLGLRQDLHSFLSSIAQLASVYPARSQVQALDPSAIKRFQTVCNNEINKLSCASSEPIVSTNAVPA